MPLCLSWQRADIELEPRVRRQHVNRAACPSTVGATGEVAYCMRVARQVVLAPRSCRRRQLGFCVGVEAEGADVAPPTVGRFSPQGSNAASLRATSAIFATVRSRLCTGWIHGLVPVDMDAALRRPFAHHDYEGFGAIDDR